MFPAERLFNATLGSPLPSRTANADMRYSYDSSGARVLKTAVDRNGAQRHTLYISGAVEVRSATYSTFSGEYTLNPERVSLRLPAGFATARVMYTSEYLPDDTMSGFGGFTSIDRHQHMFLELSDHLGSSSAIIDHETGELVEFSTYEAYGTTESDYRPGRWDNFREQYKFSGKEEDIEVGLVYFGARFYSPYLNVWMSPDPVTIHDLGSDTNPYSYVAGRPVMAVDPDGRAIFTLTALAVAAVIGAVVAAATSVVVQAAANDWNFKQIDWGIKGVLGQALVGAVTSAVSFGVGSVVSSAVGATGAAAVAVGSATGAGLGAANYGIGSAITGSQVTAAGFASAVAGGAAGGAVGGTGCGFGTSLAAGGTGATASFVSGAAITGDWSAKGFALSVGSAVAGAAAGFGLGMLCFVRGTKVTRADGSQEAIEDVELGERVLPSSEACEALDVSDWQRYDFVVEGKEADQSDALSVALLRPQDWMPDLVVGGRLWLDLEELGIHGWATLQSITEADVEGPGVGCPVTGNFTGKNDGVMTLYLEGEDKPLELTEGHRLFSATRGDWVPAVKLAIGEELQTLEGTVKVARKVLTPSRVEQVYNLEVADVHAYHVGRVGVLAHNQEAMCTPDQNQSYDDPSKVAGGADSKHPKQSVDPGANHSVAPDPNPKQRSSSDSGDRQRNTKSESQSQQKSVDWTEGAAGVGSSVSGTLLHLSASGGVMIVSDQHGNHGLLWTLDLGEGPKSNLNFGLEGSLTADMMISNFDTIDELASTSRLFGASGGTGGGVGAEVGFANGKPRTITLQYGGILGAEGHQRKSFAGMWPRWSE